MGFLFELLSLVFGGSKSSSNDDRDESSVVVPEECDAGNVHGYGPPCEAHDK